MIEKEINYSELLNGSGVVYVPSSSMIVQISPDVFSIDEYSKPKGTLVLFTNIKKLAEIVFQNSKDYYS